MNNMQARIHSLETRCRVLTITLIAMIASISATAMMGLSSRASDTLNLRSLNIVDRNGQTVISLQERDGEGLLVVGNTGQRGTDTDGAIILASGAASSVAVGSEMGVATISAKRDSVLIGVRSKDQRSAAMMTLDAAGAMVGRQDGDSLRLLR